MAISGWIGVDLDGTLAHYDGWANGDDGASRTYDGVHPNETGYAAVAAACVDHVHPVKHKGETTPENLVACCQPCNSVASGNLFENIDKKREYILEKRDIDFLEPSDEEFIYKGETFARPSWHAIVYGGKR